MDRREGGRRHPGNLSGGSRGRPLSPARTSGREPEEARGRAAWLAAGPGRAGAFREESSGGGRMFGAQAAKAVIKPQQMREREGKREGGEALGCFCIPPPTALWPTPTGAPPPLGEAGAPWHPTPGSRRQRLSAREPGAAALVAK